LIGQRGALDVTCAQSETHSRGVGGDQPQTIPGCNKAIVLSALDHQVVEQRDGGHGQLGACLRERLGRHLVQQLGLLAQMGEKLIELAMDAFSHASQQQCHQGWQRQFALAREGRWMKGMGRSGEKLG